MELVKSVSIENMVNQRAAVVARLNQALDLIAEAEALAAAANVGFPRLVIDNHYALRGRTLTLCGQYASRDDDVRAAMLRTVDGPAWQYLMKESGLRTFMDAEARSKWDNQIHEGDVPELTAENVRATFGALYGSRGEMFERGVLECFRRLSWNYKTNEPFKFGKRIILNYLFSYGSPNHRTTDQLDDLLRVFYVLDGKPEPDHRNGFYLMVSDARQRGETQAENAYLHVKWFKKGSGHVLFKRPDLVEKMNGILAKHYPHALASEVR
ncbi:DUF4942 domain-containing protein (plasmid) [Acidovorax sp. YS12]|nr:DUF4942 domain-containing protein [Acidovorax sp. YS12]